MTDQNGTLLPRDLLARHSDKQHRDRLDGSAGREAS